MLGGGGSGGMLLRENFDKNGAIWFNLGVLKYAITKLKIRNFKVNEACIGGYQISYIP